MLPNPIFQFSIGQNIEIKVHMYGVMIALGILATFIVLFTYGKKIGLKLLKLSNLGKFSTFYFKNIKQKSQKYRVTPVPIWALRFSFANVQSAPLL